MILGPDSVLITGARAPVALHMARLLAAAGHPIVLVDHLDAPLAAASSVSRAYFKIPPFSESPAEAGAALSKIADQENIKLIVPTCEEVLHLAALKDRGLLDVELFAPPLPILVEAHNKYRFVQKCAEIGLAIPDTALVKNTEDLKRFASHSKHMVFKPVWSRFASKTLVRPSEAALAKAKPSAASPWVAQQFIDGQEISIFALAKDGHLIGLSAYCGLVRAGLGAAVAFEPVNHPALRDFAEAYIGATNWTGQISFDVIETANGQVLPIECNPRATSGLHFFGDGPALASAIMGTRTKIQPDIQAPLSVALALKIYGLPLMLKRSGRRNHMAALRYSTDVISTPDDPISLWRQLRSVAEFARLSLRHRISLQEASTWGIEWNGETHSSIS